MKNTIIKLKSEIKSIKEKLYVVRNEYSYPKDDIQEKLEDRLKRYQDHLMKVYLMNKKVKLKEEITEFIKERQYKIILSNSKPSLVRFKDKVLSSLNPLLVDKELNIIFLLTPVNLELLEIKDFEISGIYVDIDSIKIIVRITGIKELCIFEHNKNVMSLLKESPDYISTLAVYNNLSKRVFSVKGQNILTQNYSKKNYVFDYGELASLSKNIDPVLFKVSDVLSQNNVLFNYDRVEKMLGGNEVQKVNLGLNILKQIFSIEGSRSTLKLKNSIKELNDLKEEFM